jgi:glycosyltransferase involved in cell wall biosynthesis
MPNYNQAHYLPTALDAILSQSYQLKEIIIVDDASTDNSMEILESYAAKYNIIKLIRNEKNLGVVINSNRLLEYATGDYIYGAAADDRVLPGLFEKSMNLLAEYPQAGICTSLTRKIDRDGIDLGVYNISWVSQVTCYLSPQQVLAIIEKWSPFFVGNTCIYKRSALIDLGGLDPKLGPFSDAFAMLAIALKYGACFIPEPLGCFRIMESSYSQLKLNDIDFSRHIIDNTVYFMRHSNPDIFPQKFVKIFERRMICGLGMNICNRLGKDQDAALSKIELLLHQDNKATPVNRVFLFALRWWFSIAKSITNLFLQMNYLFGWSWILRRLRRFIDQVKSVLTFSDFLHSIFKVLQ